MRKGIEAAIMKYNRYVRNISWHINNNSPTGIELEKCEAQLQHYKEIIADLVEILQKETFRPIH